MAAAATYRCEVVLDVESLANFLRGLALHHGGDLGTGQVQEGLGVQIVGGLSTRADAYTVQ